MLGVVPLVEVLVLALHGVGEHKKKVLGHRSRLSERACPPVQVTL
jgi:hypothetical protein